MNTPPGHYHRPRHQHHRRWVGTIIFTAGLLGLIVLAIGNVSPGIAGWVLASVIVITSLLHYILPGNGLFSAVFANSVGIYACMYIFFASVNFTKVSPIPAQVGFVLPLIAFVAGLLWHRKRIAKAFLAEERSLNFDLVRAAAWLLPLAAVGLITFLVPLDDMTAGEQDKVLLASMGIISITVLLASRDVALFLLDAGIVIEEFFTNMARLAKPAFAFFTWYSLLTIVYGCIYTIISAHSATHHFIVHGADRPITFAEGLYLSVVTLSTVGYGDVVASSPAARVLIASEIFLGVLLLLFGVEAILRSNRDNHSKPG
jgi:voltage-gated potassium channel